MARNLDEPGANFNQLLELSIKLQNARTFAGTVADASTEMEQYPDTYLRPGETLEDWTGHYFRKPNAAGGRIYGEYAQQLASGGRVGYQEGKTVLPKAKPKDYAGTLKMLLSKEAWNTLGARTWTDLTFDYAKKAREAGQISDKTYKNLMMPLFGETGEKITKAIAKHDELNEGGRVGLAEGDTPSQAWMRDYFFSGKGGYDDRMSFPEFQIGPGIDLWHRFGKSN